jgi:uncharacterized membrane protein
VKLNRTQILGALLLALLALAFLMIRYWKYLE